MTNRSAPPPPHPVRSALVVFAALMALMLPAGLVAARQPGAPSLAAVSGLASDGTPAVGKPLVIEAPARPAATPTPTGAQILRIAGPPDGPDTLDPAQARDVDTAFLSREIFRGLTRLDVQLQPQPELAQQIVISADGLEYTITLRVNATFQDGNPITSDDVVFSLERALDPDTAGGDLSRLGGPTYLADIMGAADVMAGRTHVLAGVQKLDERTVRIRLTAPRATFLMKLAAAPAAIVERQDVLRGGEWWKTPVGSGPFRVASWTPNAQLTLVRYDGFAGGPVPLQRIEVALGPNAQQPFNLYQAGTVDIAQAPVDVVERVTDPSSAYKSQVTVTPLFAVEYIAFRSDTPPTDDPHIRRAIQLAFPRQKVADVTYDGTVRAAAGLIPDGMLGRDWPVKTLPYDLAAARREIAASRYKTAAAVPPLVIYGADVSSAESLRDSLAASLGLRVEVVSVDWSDFLSGLSQREYPAYELYWLADYPDPESLLQTLFGSGSADNYVDEHNSTMDRLLREAAAEPDLARRAALDAQAQQALMDDNVVIPTYDDVQYTLAKPAVHGLQVTPLGILDLDSVWLEH